MAYIKMKLTGGEARATYAALSQSLVAIQLADTVGPQVFPAREIGAEALDRETAVDSRTTGKSVTVLSISVMSTTLVKQALDIWIAPSNRSTQGIAPDFQGRVEREHAEKQRRTQAA